MSKHRDGIKCGYESRKGIHDFKIDNKELYIGEDGEEFMKREVRCKAVVEEQKNFMLW